ncbi:uncharacterized protein MELLADRAFT_70743 [Melampsora larici-populina 98AG31]|uniref:Uncharacterized protein n=1 Tax=Melampsora larici-populina (strain 98AG31 / pathotype 3-4-7) TaxID=747676 RepID=F4R7G4_MELLP|nr:uncharacterized protein MELLADRAFT_70743 [Melampsora larici-populina 98AG31]EGG11790.1 hypothetical protein MELLADRAFT_70743 [Melampsora larici-populina 98AG31]
MSHRLYARMPESRLSHPTVFSSSTFPHVTDTSSVLVHCYMESFLRRYDALATLPWMKLPLAIQVTVHFGFCLVRQTDSLGRFLISSDHRHDLLPARGTLGGLQMSAEHPPSSLGLVTTRVPCMLHRTHQVTNQLAAPICPIFLHLVSTRSVSFLASPRRTFDSLHKKFIGTVYVPARHSPYGWRCE